MLTATNMTIAKLIARFANNLNTLWFSSYLCTFLIYIPQGQVSLFTILYYLVDMIKILSIKVQKIG